MSVKFSDFNTASTLEGFTLVGLQGSDNAQAPSELIEDLVESLLAGIFVDGLGTTFNTNKYDLGGIIEDTYVEIDSVATAGENAASYLSFINDGTASTMALGSMADIGFLPNISSVTLSPDYGRLNWNLATIVEEIIEVGVNGIKLSYHSDVADSLFEINDTYIGATFDESSYLFSETLAQLNSVFGVDTGAVGISPVEVGMYYTNTDGDQIFFNVGQTNGALINYNVEDIDSSIQVEDDITINANGNIVLSDFINATLGTDASGNLIDISSGSALQKEIAGTSYEVEEGDNGYILICTHPSFCSINIPGSLSVGLSFSTIRASGAGPVTHFGTGFMTLNTDNGFTDLQSENTASYWVVTDVGIAYGFGPFGASGDPGIQDVILADGVLTEDLSTISGPNGIVMNFGEAPSGIIGLEFYADQFVLGSDELFLTNVANDLSILFDSASDPLNPIILISGDVHHQDGTFDFQATPTVGGQTLATEATAVVIASDRIDGSIWKDAVVAASTANVNTSNAGTTMDGVAINTLGLRVLLKDQTTASQNGIYQVSAVSPNVVLSRASDFDSSGSTSVKSNSRVPVNSGTVNGMRVFKVATPNPIVVGTTAISFVDAFYTPWDIAITDSSRGLLLRSANGHYWRYTVDNSGNMSAGFDVGTTPP